MDNIELKPCPFCGGEGRIRKVTTILKDGVSAGVTVRCKTCGAQIKPIYEMPHFSYPARLEVAVRDWNRRVEK